MALFPRITTWVSNQVLTASALNAEFNNILANAQVSSMVGFSASVTQMQQQTNPGGVGSESLAGSGSDELQRMRFMLAYIMGTTYWYDQTGGNLSAGGVKTASLANLSVTTAKIANQAVTSAQIANGAVTVPQLAALNYGLSASSGSFSTTNINGAGTNPTTLNSANVPCSVSNFVSTGRMVRVKLMPAVGTVTGNLLAYRSSGTANALGIVVSLYRFDLGATTYQLVGTVNPSIQTNGNQIDLTIAPGSIEFFDTPAAGTHSYSIYVSGFYSGDQANVNNVQMLVTEIY